MDGTFDVRFWAIKVRRNRAGKVASYGVQWVVAGERFYESFKVRTQAEGFRSDLVSAQRRSEKFGTSSGLPVSRARVKADVSWFDFTCSYVDMKWPDLAATARQTVAEALIRIMPVFVPEGKAAPDPKVLRSALRQWGYNTGLRTNGEVPREVRRMLDWCARNTLSVRTAVEADVLRSMQRAVTRRLDGGAYAPAVARKTRSVLRSALDYAIECGLLDVNPLAGVKWTAMPKGKRKVDKRAVPNPIQARTLLRAWGIFFGVVLGSSRTSG